uniref:Uncharacterized protein n=1 Tax=Anguilla anguilla TaxID=7936 RepID=A0A0E9QV95_ANGAN
MNNNRKLSCYSLQFMQYTVSPTAVFNQDHKRFQYI